MKNDKKGVKEVQMTGLYFLKYLMNLHPFVTIFSTDYLKDDLILNQKPNFKEILLSSEARLTNSILNTLDFMRQEISIF